MVSAKFQTESPLVLVDRRNDRLWPIAACREGPQSAKSTFLISSNSYIAADRRVRYRKSDFGFRQNGVNLSERF